MHALILATALLDQGESEAARQRRSSVPFRAAAELGSAYRLQALLSADFETASEAYLQAWAAGEAPAELAVEIAAHFMQGGRSGDLKAFVDALPSAVRNNERIILARAMVAADDGQFDELEKLLMSRQFATIREGETRCCSDLWVRLRRGRLEAELKRARANARRNSGGPCGHIPSAAQRWICACTCSRSNSGRDR